MWTSIGDQVTDLIFRMEQLDEDFVGSTWKETATIHESAPSPTDISQQQQAADRKAHKDRLKRWSRFAIALNASAVTNPARAAAAKKYKNCCMRKNAGTG